MKLQMKVYNFDMSWYLYIAQAKKTGNYYVGISTDVKKRIAVHNKGKGSVMARTQGPFELVYKSKRLPNQSVARKLEIKTKALTKKQKIKLVEGSTQLPKR
ncbi:MAG: GIY-YIG nuclease family protein [bacterium]|nr:GIY-YIG nuclease family protein [bacterium]